MSMRAVSLSPDVPFTKLKRPDPPVAKLALGILLQALRDVVAPAESSKEDIETWRADAEAWFRAEATEPGSLNWVCQVLEMNPTGLRDWLDRYEDSSEYRRREWAKRLTRFHIPH